MRSQVIKEIHPTEVYNINTISKLLVLHKNILRIIEKKGCKAKNESFLLFLKWSKDYNEWVLDRGTNLYRDINGIKESDLGLHLKNNITMLSGSKKLICEANNNKKFNEFCKDINLFKNNTKFLAFSFDVKNETLSPEGMFQFCQYKKRKGIYSKTNKRAINIDISESFINKIIDTSTTFKSNNRICLDKNYKIVYSEYIEYLKGLSKESFYSNNNIRYENYFNSNKLFTKSLMFKDYYRYKNSIVDLSKNHIDKFLFVDMNIQFGIFLKKYFNKKTAQKLVVYDSISDSFIKLVGDYYLINENNSYNSPNTADLYEPLMPKSF